MAFRVFPFKCSHLNPHVLLLPHQLPHLFVNGGFRSSTQATCGQRHKMAVRRNPARLNYWLCAIVLTIQTQAM